MGDTEYIFRNRYPEFAFYMARLGSKLFVCELGLLLIANLLSVAPQQHVSCCFLFWDVVDTDGGIASSGTPIGCKSLVPVLGHCGH